MDILANKRLFFAGILLFGLLAMTARTATDPDLWWHLRSGQWIVETGHVPHSDPFSFTRGGSPWISHEWLSEVAFFELWKHAGPGTLIAFSSIIITSGFLLLYLRCPGKPYWAAAATVLGAWASAPTWGARPQMFTFTLASLFLFLIERAEDRPRLLLFIPPLLLLWINLHGGFALGLALLFLYAAGLAFECLAGSTPWHQARPIIVRILVTAAVCLALVPLNPSGAALYRYPLDTLHSHAMRSLIVEWFSPDFHVLLYLPFLLVFLLLFVALSASRSSIPGRTLLPLLFTAFAALDAVRHIPIFILLAIPVIAMALPDSRNFSALSRHRPDPRFRPLFTTAALLLLAVLALLRWQTLVRQQPTREAALFPARAAAFLQANLQPERLFIYYDWGGYAIWKLSPHYRVFADGRADLYGDQILRQSIETVIDLHHGWRNVLDTWNIQTIVVPPTAALAQALLLDPQWTSLYHDNQAVIFVRATSSR